MGGSGLGVPARVLIVEDDHIVRRMLARFVSELGGEALAVATGERALQELHPGRFQALLTDVDLGSELDGLEVARRALVLDPTLHVVVMSGSQENAERAEQAGIPAFLSKPVDFDTLARVLGLCG